jgi:hypothetical protein
VKTTARISHDLKHQPTSHRIHLSQLRLSAPLQQTQTPVLIEFGYVEWNYIVALESMPAR